jgi:hypothetical protein
MNPIPVPQPVVFAINSREDCLRFSRLLVVILFVLMGSEWRGE